ncbi:MAG: asparagine synthase-related protein [Cyanobacteria bacterium P01_G01_bin.54]
MSGIYVSIGSSSFKSDLSSIAHRGRLETFRQEFESATGVVRLQEFSHHNRVSSGIDERLLRRYAIVFDGCLYNRTELLQLSDTQLSQEVSSAEILLSVFNHIGTRCFDYLDGAFTFVIWDNELKKLYAVRDRFGLRPLYIFATPENLVIASEIKQFFELPSIQARLNTARAVDFLILGLTDHSVETMFENVYRLPQGSMLELDLSNWKLGHKLPTFKTWYQLPAPDSLELGETESVDLFRHLLTDVVQNRWQSQSPCGLCLSGGLDSASIAAILATNRFKLGEPSEIPTFKVYFGDEEFDQSALFQSIATLDGITNYQTTCNFDDVLRLMEPLVWHLDEPYSRPSLAAQWILFKHANMEGIKATLDGQGADEQLCGYTSMINEYYSYQESKQIPIRMQSFTTRSTLSLKQDEGGLSWLSSEQQEACFKHSEQNLHFRKRSLGEICIDRVLYGDLPMMMRHNDRIGASHGIETHVPYLAHRLVELSIALGSKHKLVGQQSKYLLRCAMGGLVPKLILNHYGKGSYSKLEEGWIRTSSDQNWLKEVVATAYQWPQLFSEKGVLMLANQHTQANKQTLLLLWRILCFGVWARVFNLSI